MFLVLLLARIYRNNSYGWNLLTAMHYHTINLNCAATVNSRQHTFITYTYPTLLEDLNINGEDSWPIVQFIKIQRQKLGFSRKVRKAKHPDTSSYLDFSSKWRSCLQESSERDCVWDVSPYISSAGVKIVYHYCLFQWKLVWILGFKVCVTTEWNVRLTSETVLFFDLPTSFIYRNTNEISLQICSIQNTLESSVRNICRLHICFNKSTVKQLM